jgi:hypothetical protein
MRAVEGVLGHSLEGVIRNGKALARDKARLGWTAAKQPGAGWVE